jgi:hypothetical protein
MDGGAELDALSIGLSGMHGTRAMVGRAACRCAMLIWTHIITAAASRPRPVQLGLCLEHGTYVAEAVERRALRLRAHKQQLLEDTPKASRRIIQQRENGYRS